MISVNLLPDVKQEFLRAKRMKTRVISLALLLTIGALGLVVALAFWVYVAQPLMSAGYSSSIAKKRTELRGVPDLDKYLTLQNQLNNIDSLHEKKNDFSRLMTYLPKLNPAAPNTVKLSNIELKAADGPATMTIRGETKDYTALNVFRDTLRTAKLQYKGSDDKPVKEKLFDSVSVDSSSLDKSTNGGAIVSFGVTVTFNPNAFLFSVKQPDVVVENADTTASVQAAPDVFGKSSKQEEKKP